MAQKLDLDVVTPVQDPKLRGRLLRVWNVVADERGDVKVREIQTDDGPAIQVLAPIDAYDDVITDVAAHEALIDLTDLVDTMQQRANAALVAIKKAAAAQRNGNGKAQGEEKKREEQPLPSKEKQIEMIESSQSAHVEQEELVTKLLTSSRSKKPKAKTEKKGVVSTKEKFFPVIVEERSEYVFRPLSRDVATDIRNFTVSVVDSDGAMVKTFHVLRAPLELREHVGDNMATKRAEHGVRYEYADFVDLSREEDEAPLSQEDVTILRIASVIQHGRLPAADAVLRRDELGEWEGLRVLVQSLYAHNLESFLSAVPTLVRLARKPPSIEKSDILVNGRPRGQRKRATKSRKGSPDGGDSNVPEVKGRVDTNDDGDGY